MITIENILDEIFNSEDYVKLLMPLVKSVTDELENISFLEKFNEFLLKRKYNLINECKIHDLVGSIAILEISMLYYKRLYEEKVAQLEEVSKEICQYCAIAVVEICETGSIAPPKSKGKNHDNPNTPI